MAGEWFDTYLLSLQVQVSFTDKRAQNKLKHQDLNVRYIRSH